MNQESWKNNGTATPDHLPLWCWGPGRLSLPASPSGYAVTSRVSGTWLLRFRLPAPPVGFRLPASPVGFAVTSRLTAPSRQVVGTSRRDKSPDAAYTSNSLIALALPRAGIPSGVPITPPVGALFAWPPPARLLGPGPQWALSSAAARATPTTGCGLPAAPGFGIEQFTFRCSGLTRGKHGFGARGKKAETGGAAGRADATSEPALLQRLRGKHEPS